MQSDVVASSSSSEHEMECEGCSSLTIEQQLIIQREDEMYRRMNGAFVPDSSESTEIVYRWIDRPPNVDTVVVHHWHWDTMCASIGLVIGLIIVLVASIACTVIIIRGK